MANGATFKADLSKWATKFSLDMDALARQTAQEVSLGVVSDTPVDTGFLRGSWQPSLKAPVVAKGVGNPGALIGVVVADMKAGDTYWMTNNAKYAEFVEFGTSRMAGRFFTTNNVTRFPDIAARVARSLAK